METGTVTGTVVPPLQLDAGQVLIALSAVLIAFVLEVAVRLSRERRFYRGLLLGVCAELVTIRKECRGRLDRGPNVALDAPLPCQAWRIMVASGFLLKLKGHLEALTSVYLMVDSVNYLSSEAIRYIHTSLLVKDELAAEELTKEARRVVAAHVEDLENGAAQLLKQLRGSGQREEGDP